jgi:hypothetical protein
VINEVEHRRFGCPNGRGAIPVPLYIAPGEIGQQYYCPIEYGEDLIQNYGMIEGLKWGGFWAVYGFYLLFVIGTLFSLRYVSYQKR